MNILGVDYGLSKVGVAIAVDTPLAEPLATIVRESDKEVIELLSFLIDEHQIDLVVMGLPKGILEKQVKNFAESLVSTLKVKVELIDEFYTSKQAQFHARQAGRNKGKIKRKEHEWAAVLILQSYLDSV